jgi:hypothetical protein
MIYDFVLLFEFLTWNFFVVFFIWIYFVVFVAFVVFGFKQQPKIKEGILPLTFSQFNFG